MHGVRIGTSGYSYEDWRGVFYPPDLPFYPPDLPKGEMLTYYARYFTTWDGKHPMILILL